MRKTVTVSQVESGGFIIDKKILDEKSQTLERSTSVKETEQSMIDEVKAYFAQDSGDRRA